MPDSEKPSLFKRLYNPISTRGMLQFYRHYEKTYIGLCVLSASIGYLFLLFFPVTTLVMLDLFQANLRMDNTVIQWLITAAYLLAGLFTGYYSVVIFLLRFTPPAGLEIDKGKFTLLASAMDEIEEAFNGVTVHRYVLTLDNNIQACKTPRYGYPFISKRSITIGMATLLNQSPLYFKVQLARSVGLLYGAHNRVTGWAWFSTQYWKLYYQAFRESKLPFSSWPGYFFKVYAPFHESFSIGLARHVEKEADRYAMEAYNHEDVIESLIYNVSSQYFLESNFWPKITQAALLAKTLTHPPYAHMSNVIRNSMKAPELQALSKHVMSQPDDYKSSMPLPISRLRNLGYDQALTPKPMAESAAEHFLSTALAAVVNLFDKQWFIRLKKKPA